MSAMVHLVDLDLPGPDLARLTAHLDDAELERAEALRDPRDRARFCAGHGWVRVALARELGISPAGVPLLAPTDAKPWVEGTALRFSASRSAGSGVIALSWSGEVGVDVEEVRDGPDPLRFAARWYTPAERRIVQQAPAELRNRRCLEIWTRKEAYLKATGSGLTVSPAGVEVAPAGLGPARIGAWVVHQLAAGPGLTAAVAVPDDPLAERPERTGPPEVCGLHLDGTTRPALDRAARLRRGAAEPAGALDREATSSRGAADDRRTASPGPGRPWSAQPSEGEPSPGFNAATKRSSSPTLWGCSTG